MHGAAANLYKSVGSDVQYLQFIGDIKGLGESLRWLKDILENAEEQRPRYPWHGDVTNSIDPTTSHALKEVTGDFRRTLLDCETLLDDNARFQRSPAGFVDNIVWHASTKSDVKNLHQRVHFHMTKINYIAKPLELHLLFGIRRELQHLRREVAELRSLIAPDNDSRRGRLINGKEADRHFSIPKELDERFTVALLSANSPSSFLDETNLPLKQGFDALVYHIANSTVNFKPSLGGRHKIPEDMQYLNLLKSKWIKEKLQHSEHFQSVEQESLWRRYMREIEDEIADQIIRFEEGELLAPSLEVLRRLPDHCFSIWITETKPRPAAQADQRLDEEKILEAAIYNPNETLETKLIVFAKSDFAFRLVSTTKDEQNEKFYGESEVEVNMKFTQLVPMFAVSQDYSMNSDNQNKVCLYGNQGQGGNCFAFQNPKDVAKFQRALTNYRVSYETSKVSWHIEFEKLDKSSLSGEARLQLWHLKPLPGMNRSGESSPSENADKSSAENLQPPGASLRRFWTSGTARTPSSSIVSPVSGSSGDGVALTPPELPVLLVYTKCDDRHAILHIRCTLCFASLPCLY